MEQTLEIDKATAAIANHATLKGRPSETETQYTVGLSGPVDARWVERFRAFQAESTGFRRFRLDASSATVSFSCRTVEGPTQVIEVLERLDALLELVNGPRED